MSQVRPSTQLAADGAAAGDTLKFDGTAWLPGAAVNIVRDRLTAAGGETLLTLGDAPISESLLVWVNGALAWPGVDYTLSGSVATFGTALAAADVVTDYYLTDAASDVAATLTAPPMPPTVVASVQGKNDPFPNASSLTVTLPSATAVGDVVIVGTTIEVGAAVSSITGLGGTWAQLGQEPTGWKGELWQCTGVSAGQTSITVNWASAGHGAVSAVLVRHVPSGVISSSVGTNVNSNPATIASVSVPGASRLVVAMGLLFGSSPNTFTPVTQADGSWTVLPSVFAMSNGSTGIYTAYHLSAAAGTQTLTVVNSPADGVAPAVAVLA